MNWLQDLRALGACGDSLIWAERFSTREECWDACEKADWLMWIVGRLSGRAGDPRRVTLALCAADIAETALPYAGETRPACEKAISAIRSWARGEVTVDDLRSGASAAWANAADAAAASAAAFAATAAATADATAAIADAADAASYAAAFAANAAATAAIADAADAADAAIATYAAAYDKALRDLCEIVRRHYPSAPSLTEVTK